MSLTEAAFGPVAQGVGSVVADAILPGNSMASKADQLAKAQFSLATPVEPMSLPTKLAVGGLAAVGVFLVTQSVLAHRSSMRRFRRLPRGHRS